MINIFLHLVLIIYFLRSGETIKYYLNVTNIYVKVPWMGKIVTLSTFYPSAFYLKVQQLLPSVSKLLIPIHIIYNVIIIC